MYGICERCGSVVKLKIERVECEIKDYETVKVTIWIDAFCDRCDQHITTRVEKVIGLSDLIPAFAKIPIHGWSVW